MIWTKAFWQGAGERAIKSAAQGFITAVGGTAVNLWTVDLLTAGEIVLSMAALSLITSLGNADFTAGVQNVVKP